jgi:hypothetical protein
MTILRKGHRYSLSAYEGGRSQQIQFIEKAPVGDDSSALETVFDGTTNEEVMEMLLDRMNFLNSVLSCWENSNAILKLGEALMWLRIRTANRMDRGVEGTDRP